MIATPDELDAALDAGRRVYLHCLGGVARTVKLLHLAVNRWLQHVEPAEQSDKSVAMAATNFVSCVAFVLLTVQKNAGHGRSSTEY